MTRIAMPTAATLALALIATASPGQAQGPMEQHRAREPVIIEPSAREYLNSCASCHGIDGKGAGFLTRLFRGIDPGDLTQLSARNGGSFPLEHVFSVIDGRAEVAAHGERRMPVWGDRYMNEVWMAYGPDEMNQARVRNRIYELVHYLQEIQETPEGTQD